MDEQELKSIKLAGEILKIKGLHQLPVLRLVMYFVLVLRLSICYISFESSAATINYRMCNVHS